MIRLCARSTRSEHGIRDAFGVTACAINEVSGTQNVPRRIELAEEPPCFGFFHDVDGAKCSTAVAMRLDQRGASGEHNPCDQIPVAINRTRTHSNQRRVRLPRVATAGAGVLELRPMLGLLQFCPDGSLIHLWGRAGLR